MDISQESRNIDERHTMATDDRIKFGDVMHDLSAKFAAQHYDYDPSWYLL